MHIHILKNSPYPIIIHNKGKIVFFNDKSKKIIGASTDSQLLNQELMSFIHPKYQEFVVNRIGAISKGEEKESVNHEISLINLYGEEVEIEYSSTIIDFEGEPSFLIMFRDITNENNIKRKLKQSEEKYCLVINSVKEIIFQMDLKGNWNFLNAPWVEILGYSVEESLGSHFSQYIHPDDKELSSQEIKKLINRERENCNFQLRYYTKDRSVRWMDMFIYLLINNENEVVGYSGTLINITEKKVEELKKAEELELAKVIQQSVLTPPIQNLDIQIEAFYQPSEHLSGDMYNWYQIDEYRYGIILLDVMGHGVPSSLVSMSISSLLRGLITRVKDPIQIFKEISKHMNHLFMSNSTKSLLSYLTGFCLTVDTKNKVIEYVNAGHPPGLLQIGDSRIVELRKGSIPIGLMPDVPIEKEILPYDDFVRIVVYTDGLLEALSKTNSKSIEKLNSYLLQLKTLNNTQFLHHIVKSIKEENPSYSDDDICAISITIPKNEKQ